MSSLLLIGLFATCSVYRIEAQVNDTEGGGASSGKITPPVFDKQGRPITAGGFVTSGAMVFKDVSDKSGLTSWHHTMGSASKDFIIETDGSGVALLDFDNDGWIDIYLVNGSTEKAQAGETSAPQAALFHNNHNGSFTNVAQSSGVTNDRWGFGAAVGDFNNDGWPDIYVTNFGKNRLYRNNRNGTFTDIAVEAGVQVEAWSTGATFGDYDGDGFLDLFVPGYVNFDFEHLPLAGTKTTSFHTCQFRKINVSCGPRGLEGARDHLFHNNGDETFSDVSEQSGVADEHRFYGFTGLFVDVNGDRKPDLIVANDSTPNYLYINQGAGVFKEQGSVSGLAYNRDGREVASMGLAVGDYLNDGSVSVSITNFSDDYKLLFQNDGHGNFTEVSEKFGLSDNTAPFLGWGVGFLDYDNDGWKDLMMFNGHVYPIVDKMNWGTSYRQRPLLFHNRHGRAFDLQASVQDTGLALVNSSRGAAFGDLFNDGRLDVVINNLDGTPVVLRNVDANTSAWVEIKLIGGPGSPRDAVGATVLLKQDGLTQRQDVLSGGSFLSSNDQRVHFGLGHRKGDVNITILWPSGRSEQKVLPQKNMIYTIREGESKSFVAPAGSKSDFHGPIGQD